MKLAIIILSIIAVVNLAGLGLAFYLGFKLYFYAIELRRILEENGIN